MLFHYRLLSLRIKNELLSFDEVAIRQNVGAPYQCQALIYNYQDFIKRNNNK
jgi:hypothetical protein